MSDFLSDFGTRMAQKRKELGLSQAELGELIAVSRFTISNWEKNAISPSVKEAYKIASCLKVDLYDLMGMDIPEGVEIPFNTPQKDSKAIACSCLEGIEVGPHPENDLSKNRNQKVFELPVFKYSALTGEVIDMEISEDSEFVPIDCLEGTDPSDCILVKQDIPFRLVETGPLPADVMVIVQKGENTFQNGYLHLVTYNRQILLRRVVKNPDESVILSCDKERTIVQGNEVQNGLFKILGRALVGLKTQKFILNQK